MLASRVRFVEYQPKAINSIAINRQSDGIFCGAVAVARENGNIDIYNSKTNFHLNISIPLVINSSVEVVLWVANRLFSAGVDGYIREWDLVKLKPKYAVESNGGAIWSMQASHDNLKIAIGCEDGRVRIFDINDDNSFSFGNKGIQFLKGFDKAEARILSLAWHPSSSYLIAGTANGQIRKYQTDSAQCIATFKLDRPKDSDPTLCWALLFLNESFVCGDSLGKVSFFNFKTFTLIKSIKSHHADVLCLTKTPDGECVYSSGVDRVIVQHRKLNDSKWVKTLDRRYHSHDVRSLALLFNETTNMLISGGLDTQLIVSKSTSKISAFDKVKQHRVCLWPGQNVVQILKEKRWVVERLDSGIKISEIGSAENDDLSKLNDQERLPLQNKGRLLMHLKLALKSNLVASKVSPNGEILAVSDAFSVKLFSLKRSKLDGRYQVEKIKLSTDIKFPASAIAFSKDSKRLILGCLGGKSEVTVFDIEKTSKRTWGLEEVAKFSVGKKESQPSLVLGIEISECGRYFASFNIGNIVSIVDMEIMKIHTKLPSTESPITSVKFSPSSHQLAISTALNYIKFYDVENKSFTSWTTMNSDKRLPKWLMCRDDSIMGISWIDDKHLFIWGYNYSCFIDLNLDASFRTEDMKRKRELEWDQMPQNPDDLDENGVRRRKPFDIKKLEEQMKEGDELEVRRGRTYIKKKRLVNFIRIDRFQPLMMMECLGEKEFVVVERPLLKIMELLPEGFYRKKWGN